MIVMAASFGAADFFGGFMKKIKIILVTLCMLMVSLTTTVVSFAAEAMTVDVAKQFFSDLSQGETTVEQLEKGYTFTANDDGSVTAVMIADPSNTVKFYYGDNGVIHYSGFFGNSEDYDGYEDLFNSSVLDRGLAQTSGFLQICSDVGNFIITNELCLIFIGFLFVSRGVSVLIKCLRVTPR